MELFDGHYKLKVWSIFKMGFSLSNKFYFQLTNDIPKAWKNIVQNNVDTNMSLTFKNHRIIRESYFQL